MLQPCENLTGLQLPLAGILWAPDVVILTLKTELENLVRLLKRNGPALQRDDWFYSIEGGRAARATQPPRQEQLLIRILPSQHSSSTSHYWWLPWETHFRNIQKCSDTFTDDFLMAWKHLFWRSCGTDPTLVTECNSFSNTVLSISFISLLLNHCSWIL